MKTKFTAKAILGSALLALSASLFAQAVMTDGEVRKVDRDNQKITLKHGEIKNLDMPAMTMVFTVKNPAMLDQVKVGDKVQFHAENEAGKFTVTEIRPVK